MHSLWITDLQAQITCEPIRLTMPLKRIIVLGYNERTFTVRGIHASREIVIRPKPEEDVDMNEDCIGREHSIEFADPGSSWISLL